MPDFANQTAFITGGARGIGLGMAKALTAGGAQVMLADIKADALATAREDLAAAGVEAHTVVCDVSDPDSVAAAAETVKERFGKLDVLVNNAGVGTALGPNRPFAEWHWIFGINVMGVVHCVQTFLPQMTAPGGRILNTASVLGLMTLPGNAPYCATKHAVIGYSEVLRREMKERGISVSVLCPGMVRTEIYESGATAPDYTPDPERDAENKVIVDALMKTATHPDDVGAWAVDRMAAGDFFIFTDTVVAEAIGARYARIKEGQAAIAHAPLPLAEKRGAGG